MQCRVSLNLTFLHAVVYSCYRTSAKINVERIFTEGRDADIRKQYFCILLISFLLFQLMHKDRQLASLYTFARVSGL